MPRPAFIRLLGAACALAAVSGGAAASLATASSPGIVRLGRAPTNPAGSRVLGALATGTPMRITVALRPRDAAGLAAFAQAVSTPGSALYRHYLTPAQFAERFGATAAQVAAVRSWLRAHGLGAGALSANGLTLPVAATAGQVERAFSVGLRRLALARGGSAVFSDAAPALDADVAGLVQGVVGLSSMASRPLALRPAALRPLVRGRVRAAVRSRVATGGPQPCATARQAAASQGVYSSDQLASAYGFSSLYRAGDRGQGETIALYELEPNDPADIAAFQSCWGTRAPVSYVPVDGGVGGGAGSGEAALDIETAIAFAPRASYLVYQAPNTPVTTPGSGPFDALAAIVSQRRANVISISWGDCEPIEGAGNAAAESTLFQEAAAQGQTVVSASGDTGSEDCNGAEPANTQLAVDDPASQPFVTGVGGTTLTSLGPRPHELVWNGGGNPLGNLLTETGAGGGGISRIWHMPAYQADAPAPLRVVRVDSSGVPCGAAGSYCREVPDVSADGDPTTGLLIYYNGSGSVGDAPAGWQGIGGTSLGAPTWAALFALADASRACDSAPLGFANPALYRAAANAYPTTFNDVSSGNNDFTGTNGGQFHASPGYDMASGLGSPNASALVPALCASGLRIANPGTVSSTVGTRVTLRLRSSDAAGLGVRFSATGLPRGLSINHTTGRITGRPSRVGHSSVHVVATDTGGTSAVTTFNWVVGRAPSVSGGSLTGIGGSRARLRFGARAGRSAPPLYRVVVRPPSGLSFGSARGVSATAGGRSLPASRSVKRGALTVGLDKPSGRVQLTIPMSGGSRLRGRTVQVRVTLIDADGLATTRTLRLSARG